ncbi:MAG: hypothetical protein VB855_00855 [Pirellulaceae bacterium]
MTADAKDYILLSTIKEIFHSTLTPQGQTAKLACLGKLGKVDFMRRILLGLLFTLCIALVSLVVTFSGSLIASGNGDPVATTVLQVVTMGCLVLSAICLCLLVITLGVYVVMQSRDPTDHSP